MIKPIMKDVFFLCQKSEPATEVDQQGGKDLIDTLAAHKHECVGMASNMIGVKKNIIIVDAGFMPLVMFSPIITKKSGKYETEEACLSLIGVRPCTRYKEITVEYQDMAFKKHILTSKDWTSQIIHHDACVIIGPKVRKAA